MNFQRLRKHIAHALLAAALWSAWGATAAPPQRERAAADPVLLLDLLAWASRLSGLPAPAQVPPVIALTPAALAERVCPQAPGQCRGLVAVYDTERREVLHQDSLDLRDETDQSFIVHEFVHHLQHLAQGDTLFDGCDAVLRAETAAYAAQNRYLAHFKQWRRVGEVLRFTHCDSAAAEPVIRPGDRAAPPPAGALISAQALPVAAAVATRALAGAPPGTSPAQTVAAGTGNADAEADAQAAAAVLRAHHAAIGRGDAAGAAAVLSPFVTYLVGNTCTLMWPCVGAQATRERFLEAASVMRQQANVGNEVTRVGARLRVAVEITWPALRQTGVLRLRGHDEFRTVDGRLAYRMFIPDLQDAHTARFYGTRPPIPLSGAAATNANANANFIAVTPEP